MSMSSSDLVPFRRSPPGVDGFAPEVVGALMLRWEQLRARGAETGCWLRYRQPDGSPRFLNRLLLSEGILDRQHACDPVDWRPYGPQVFRAARAAGRPVLVWITGERSPARRAVWERVFTDLHVARGINGAYVSALVGGEESSREIERLRDAAVRLTGQRAEDAVVWLTPSAAPFAAWVATEEALQGSEGIGALIALLDQHRELPEQAAVERCSAGRRPGCSGLTHAFVRADRQRLEALLDRAATQLGERWRMYLGQLGQRGAVSPALMRFALFHGLRTGRPELQRWTEDRLSEWRRGAGRDHLGGGYFEAWQGPGRLPSGFDRELGTNAELALVFLEAWEQTAHKELFWSCVEILELAWSELRAEHGAFYAALRRPSTHDRARDLTWTRDELVATLGEDLHQVIQPVIGLWEVEKGRCLVTLPPPSDVSEQRGVRRDHIERARGLLSERRGRQAAEQLDKRVLPGPNGLLLAALSRTARNLDHIGPDARIWLDAALRCAESTTRLLWHRGRLHESFVHGVRQPAQAGFVAHVQLAEGFLELFESTGEVRWLRMCLALEDALQGLWPGRPRGAGADAGLRDRLVERERAEATASWASLLARLATLLSDPQRRGRAMALLRPWMERLEEAPLDHGALLVAAERVLAEPQVLLVWSHEDAARRAAFLAVLRSVRGPGREVVVTCEDSDVGELPARLPIAAHHRGQERAAAYVCGSRSCSRGLETPYALQRFLQGGHRSGGGPEAA
jgi:uncharacterized protein YyaL (SSP411 family)